jgi:2-polyprenyl-3-methyl-5-hydroxy-6-metoxy-1,4-benzoquinol methylase
MTQTDRHDHWETVYRTKAPDEVSWYQPSLAVSLRLIADCELPKTAAVIDIGGGASTLADHLLGEGFVDVSVLDLAETALARARARLGKAGDAVTWIADDITTWQPPQKYDLWHDRAVFHFLTDPADRLAYRRTLAAALKPRGHVVIATFALEGPERCSGLPVQRYNATSLAAELGAAFELVDSEDERHQTPGGAIQAFTYCRFRCR